MFLRSDCHISHSSGTLGHPDQPPPTDKFVLTHAVFVILLKCQESHLDRKMTVSFFFRV